MGFDLSVIRLNIFLTLCALCLCGNGMFIACTNTERQSPPPEPEPAKRSFQECYDECVKINMPRAVAWELIEGDCERACRQEVGE